MNLWSHRFSQNMNKKLTGFLPCVVRAEILTMFCSYFGRNDDFINPFWNWLTFRVCGVSRKKVACWFVSSLIALAGLKLLLSALGKKLSLICLLLQLCSQTILRREVFEFSVEEMEPKKSMLKLIWRFQVSALSKD